MNLLKEQILDYFPFEVHVPENVAMQIQEIRIRLGQPVTFRFR